MKREMVLVDYDCNWPILFEKSKIILTNIFGDNLVDIHHIGSTSVIGMKAKPIIDIMVIVKDIDRIENINYKMIQLGYIPKGENGIEGRRYFQLLAFDGINHIEHIHCYEENNSHVKEQLMFRDYLNIDKDSFNYYQQTKIEASSIYRFSPDGYTEYKTDTINKILKKAKIYYSIQK